MEIINDVLLQIIERARLDAPIEACGYLLGRDDTVLENYQMTNVDNSSEHFMLDPREQFAALRYARANNLKIMANWHSHPASPARPSAEDLRLANDPNIRYAILSLFEGVHLNSFRIINGTIVDKQVHL